MDPQLIIKLKLFSGVLLDKTIVSLEMLTSIEHRLLILFIISIFGFIGTAYSFQLFAGDVFSSFLGEISEFSVETGDG